MPPPLFGAGFRTPHFDAIARAPRALDWLEVVSENFIATGGPRRAMLERLRADHPIALHGVSLSIAGSDPLDDAYLRGLRALSDEVAPLFVSDHLCWTTLGGRQSHDLLARRAHRCGARARGRARRARSGRARAAHPARERDHLRRVSRRRARRGGVLLGARSPQRLRRTARRQQPVREFAEPRTRHTALPGGAAAGERRVHARRRTRGAAGRAHRHPRRGGSRSRLDALRRSGAPVSRGSRRDRARRKPAGVRGASRRGRAGANASSTRGRERSADVVRSGAAHRSTERRPVANLERASSRVLETVDRTRGGRRRGARLRRSSGLGRAGLACLRRRL